ncbi:MAG TPA: NAD(P)-dependent alcohol dehydrogenase [Candidatus Sulfotelmatobacter sp.]|nr:NAD(P)-dependent alcohol dehydrogenase [Candidatus Sulfotelmatobacter sp.]
MKTYILQQNSATLDGLTQIDRPDPQPAPNQVLIRVRATSLNYRDNLVANGAYFGGPMKNDLVPLSDGAGEVVSIGPAVKRFKPGDRVAGTFFQTWFDGAMQYSRPAMGGSTNGMLSELVVLDEDGVVLLPDGYSFEEGATLPCAAVTAWHALMATRNPVKAGQTVLCLGTGGVSIFALQFAKAAGARVIITSSSDDKLARAKSLGADEGINYNQTPDWEKKTAALTNKRGVDHIIEVGGPGTLAKSYKAVAPEGQIALIGVVAGNKGDTNPLTMMMKGANLQGIYVGTTKMFEDMTRAITQNKIKPVVDRIFPFDQARDAYVHLASASFQGKLVITV